MVAGTKELTINEGVTLSLKSAYTEQEEEQPNGYDGHGFCFYVQNGANFTVKGDGTIAADRSVFFVEEGGELTIGEGTDAKTAANAKFTFSGLDAGVYKLVESTTPTGYNTLPEQVFTITAEHELEADDPKLTDLSGTDGAQFNMTPVKTTETPQQFTGELDADIENKQGTELPSTGGIGTTIFYVLGAILVLGGTVVLVTRRRMAA